MNPWQVAASGTAFKEKCFVETERSAFGNEVILEKFPGQILIWARAEDVGQIPRLQQSTAKRRLPHHARCGPFGKPVSGDLRAGVLERTEPGGPTGRPSKKRRIWPMITSRDVSKRLNHISNRFDISPPSSSMHLLKQLDESFRLQWFRDRIAKERQSAEGNRTKPLIRPVPVASWFSEETSSPCWLLCYA